MGIGQTLEEAEKKAEMAASTVKGRVRHRKDIGTTGLLSKRCNLMKELR